MRHRAERAACRWAVLLSAASLWAPPGMAQQPEGLAASALADARYTWVRRRAPGFRIYFQDRSYAARHEDSLAARLPDALEHARTLLGTRAPAAPIDLFFVETRQDMGQLTGAPVTGFAHQAARAVFLVTNPGWRAFERHEIMHVVAWHAWGPPAPGTDWLQEGLAQAADGRCGGYANETVLRGLVRRRGWVTLEDLLTRFRQQPDLRAYLQAAAFTRHLLGTQGAAVLETLWREGATGDTTVRGRPLALIEREWRARTGEGEGPEAEPLSLIEGCRLRGGCGAAVTVR